jgi:hypothetical protein
MGKLLVTAAILILFGPIIGVHLGVHPAILPLVGIAFGLVAAVRGAHSPPDRDGAPSAGAEADAEILCNITIDHSPNSGIGITDVGGAEWFDAGQRLHVRMTPDDVRPAVTGSDAIRSEIG